MRFILALVAAATVQAIPEVTAVQQENTCSNWPSGLFGLTGDSTGTTIDGAKGFFQVINDPPLADGYVAINPATGYAWSPVQCQTSDVGDMLAMSRGDYFQPLAVSQTYGLLIVNPTATTEWPLEPHWHYFANGTRQPGTFVGWNNYTTWAFLQGNMFKAHRIRLLTDPAQALRPLEIAGFITAVPYGLSLED